MKVWKVLAWNALHSMKCAEARSAWRPEEVAIRSDSGVSVTMRSRNEGVEGSSMECPTLDEVC